MDSPEGALAFRRAREPNEGAFSLLVPHGWQVRGGIQRAHQAVLSAQAVVRLLAGQWLL
jgi:hypothetical protein